MKSKVQFFFLTLLLLSISLPAVAQPTRDGLLYDQGRSMSNKSPRADDVLDKAKSILGQWDVRITSYPTDSTTYSGKGMAEISYMNRGYAYMTRVHIPSMDEQGNEANLMQFLVFNPVNQTWVLGEANSYTESISMYNGDYSEKNLVMSTAVRKNGSVLVTSYEVIVAFAGEDAFSMTTKSSTDADKTWKQERTLEFTRRETSPDFMAPKADAGKPSPHRPDQTNQFDFLIGEWTANQDINIQGRWIQFPSNATAVYALNGHAILEYNWYDIDPNLPDAATTIVRLYNRSMRRWESLYLTNRGNAPLFFGGQQEGNNVVLHNFDTDTTAPTISRYVFHSIADDSYAWYAESSTDRGKTFNKTWTIENTLK